VLYYINAEISGMKVVAELVIAMVAAKLLLDFVLLSV